MSSSVRVVWDPEAKAWPEYPTDPMIVRYFVSDSAATPPIAYSDGDMWKISPQRHGHETGLPCYACIAELEREVGFDDLGVNARPDWWQTNL
jgi:hypothetical protein